jgi:large subunit ribosomal protein L3
MSLEYIARKIQMGNLFRDDGTRVPVTYVEIVPMTVTQVKRQDGPDGYSAIQVGWDPVAGHRLTRAEVGHQKKIDGKPFKNLMEIRVDDPSQFEINQKLNLGAIKIGDKVKVVGTSKGRGFAGGMKRHHFRGQSGSHGTSKTHRKPMSAGATDAARVFKGVRKPGHMGNVTVTVKNLEIAMVDAEKGLVAVTGAVPGPSGGILRIIPVNKA